MPGPGGQVEPPEVVEGGGGRGAAAEDEHGQGPVVIHGRVGIPFGDFLAVVALAAAG